MQYRIPIVNEHYDGLNPVYFGFEDCCPCHSDGPALRTYWLLHYVVSGYGIFKYRGATYQIRPGDLFTIAPYEEYFYQADKEQPWEYVWIGFFSTSPLPVQLNPVMHYPAAGRIFESMKRVQTMYRGRSAYLSSQLWQVVALLMDNDVLHSDYVKEALNWMNVEFCTGITVNEIVQRLNINRSYFYTLFHNEMKISPQQYLTNLRMERARELLIEFNKNPTVVALSTGYANLYNFSRMFKRYFGVSPREYVRMVRMK